MGDGILSLSWNNHHATFCDILKKLRKKERYTDVTLSCEGKFYPLHKFVLSTCSEYFERIFENTPCKHPVIVLSDIKCRELEALLSYMYAGAVNVPQSNLALLIKAAEILQVKGLAVPDTPPSPPNPEATTVESLSDRLSPKRKRHRTEERTSDNSKNRRESTASELRHTPQDQSRQMTLKDAQARLKEERLQDSQSEVEATLKIGEVYHDAEIKEEIVEASVDSSENELRQSDGVDYDPQLALFKSDNSSPETSGYNETHFNPAIHVENDIRTDPAEMIEWQDGIIETDMQTHEGTSGVNMLQPSSPMLGQQVSQHLAQQAKKQRILDPDERLNPNLDHVMVPLEGRKRKRCRVCYQRGVRKDTYFECSYCRIALCIACAGIYHHRQVYW